MAKKKKRRKVNTSVNSRRLQGNARRKSSLKSYKRKRVKIKSPKVRTPILTTKLKRWIGAVFMVVAAVLVAFSFFEKAGAGGAKVLNGLRFVIGNAVYAVPFLLVLGSFFLVKPKKKRVTAPMFIALFLLSVGIAGILASQDVSSRNGGWLGVIVSWPLLRYFSLAISFVVFSALVLIGVLISWEFLPKGNKKPTTLEPQKIVEGPKEEKGKRGWFHKSEPETEAASEDKKPNLEIKPIDLPKKRSVFAAVAEKKEEKKQEKIKAESSAIVDKSATDDGYNRPPLNLFDCLQEKPSSGDTNYNAGIIQKTFANFGINVEMSDVNTGPTVTQYTLKPAEGVKLSRITALNNDLALSLASHPIRIEAPIPGRSLVGVEVPNKIKAKVKLGGMMGLDAFQNSQDHLSVALGRDVMGSAILVSLDLMPHLLVAGATGSGKTCAADTLMFTEKGTLTFEELCPLPLDSEIKFKIKLVTRDGIEKTAKNYNNGICQFYKLATSRGYQVEATAEHPLWVMNEDGSQGWKPASLIKKGDYVAISRGPALFGNRTDISDFNPSRIKGSTKKISFPSKITPQLAQFLGLLTADGGLSTESKGIHRVVYTQASSHLIRLYKKSLKELFGITQFIEKRAGSNPKNKAKDIVVNSKHLKEFLAYLGMDSSLSPQKEIPKAIREGPKEIVTAYLRALFDNDGYVGKGSIELCVSSKKLASQVHIMLLNFGIVSSLLIKKVKKYAYNDYYRLSIFGQDARKFIQEIGLIRKEKYNKSKEFLKLSPNPNVDLIPHIASLLRKMGQKYLNRFARLTNQGWKYQPGILVPKHAFSSLRSYNSGFRTPGYQGLGKILDFYQPISQEPEYQELEKISERNFYWDKVEKNDRTSGVGYDFYVPGSDSFVGNGFVNHNTICLNSLIVSLVARNSPKRLRFILIDPKRVEFPVYANLPHLLTPVILNSRKAVNALNWLVGEMERRFEVLREFGARDIRTYNSDLERKPKKAELGFEILPYIVLIVDELADLMMSKGKEVEAAVVRLSQLARAVGIHLVLATQRPSVEVITGLIKANITSRIAFQVASQIDSRTIMDTSGAEKLLGRGDMLFLSSEFSKPKRIQGSFVSGPEIKKIVTHINRENVAEEIQELEEEELPEETHRSAMAAAGLGQDDIENFSAPDELYEEAKEVVLQYQKASASLLQRRLQIGYARAARILDMLEENGVVGSADGSKPRNILVQSTSEQMEDGFQDPSDLEFERK